MLDFLNSLKHGRTRNSRVIVASQIPIELARRLDDAISAFDSNRSRMVRACIEAGLPIVVAQAQAADQQSTQG